MVFELHCTNHKNNTFILKIENIIIDIGNGDNNIIIGNVSIILRLWKPDKCFIFINLFMFDIFFFSTITTIG